MFELTNRYTWASKKVIGERIHRIRKHAKLTRDKLCEQLYISTHTYVQWRSGKCYPYIDAVTQLADLCNVTVEDVLAKQSKLDDDDYAVSDYGFNNWQKIDVSNRICQLMQMRKLNSTKLARVLNVSRQTVYNWLNNRNIPSDAVTDRMTEYFNMSVEELVKESSE